MYRHLFLICLTVLSFSAFGQNIQSPDEFLPHKLGEQFSEHASLIAYYEHVAANSDRVTLQEFGRTNQKRPQVLAVVSSPENMARIEEIRLNNLRMAGMADGEPDMSNPITIVWLGYSVHGNEAAGSEASMAVIHQLTDPLNQQVAEWLKNTVVLIEPSVNPDGYSRYTSWYRQASPDQPDPLPAAREHNEPWPGGRVNHYLFDLNRDWAWATQVESQNRLPVYNSWLPHVVADLHEQWYDSPYYFAPAAQPYHEYLTDWQADFQFQIGKNHAEYFDEEGWLYFTREVFDLFYPSYGDTYPSFNGAIGMTYEQGGHSKAGRAITMPNGDVLTLSDRIAHHTTTSLSTVEISSKNADRLIKEFRDYFTTSINNPPGKYKSFIVKKSNPAYKIKALTDLLDRHGIQYGSAGGGTTGITGYDYATGREGKYNMENGDLLISAYQPKGLLTQVLLEPEHTLVDSLTYDITAWSLLHGGGLDAYASSQRLKPAGEFNLPVTKTMAKPAKTPYAYLVHWNSHQAPRFLAEVLEKDVVVRYSDGEFTVEENTYPKGTLVMTKGDNRKHTDFDEAVHSAAVKLGVELMAVSTGFVDKGRDFGSDGMRLVKKPEVLVLSGEKAMHNEFGQVWFYFDHELDYPATIIDADQLSRFDLDDYNTLVLPEGFFSFDENTLKKINSWVSAGGKLISIGVANRSLVGKDGFALKRYAKDSDAEAARSEAEQVALDHRTSRYADRTRSSISNHAPGAVVRVKMDTSHPLAFGFDDYYFSLKTGGAKYDLVKGAWNVGYLEEDYITHGFIGWKKKKDLENSTVFAVQDKGRGKIIYLIDNPLFRMFWEEGKMVFANALFLVN